MGNVIHLTSSFLICALGVNIYLTAIDARHEDGANYFMIAMV
jgi:hypothetical protein